MQGHTPSAGPLPLASCAGLTILGIKLFCATCAMQAAPLKLVKDLGYRVYRIKALGRAEVYMYTYLFIYTIYTSMPALGFRGFD